jgi:hypothetical protein
MRRDFWGFESRPGVCGPGGGWAVGRGEVGDRVYTQILSAWDASVPEQNTPLSALLSRNGSKIMSV